MYIKRACSNPLINNLLFIQVSGDPPSIKRRRISAHGHSSSSTSNKDGTTPTSGVGGASGSGQERKRRWGKQRSNSSSAANISSDVLKVSCVC